MSAHPTIGFGREQVVFTMCPFDKKALSRHRDILSPGISVHGREQRFAGEIALSCHDASNNPYASILLYAAALIVERFSHVYAVSAQERRLN